MEQLGYLADIEIAQQLIEGKFDVPDDINDATALILEEIGRIGVQVSNGNLIIGISADEFQYFWRRIKEGTVSSYSGIHYSKNLTMVAWTGCPPERWSYDPAVILKKIAGIALVNKLRAIMLM